MKLEQIRCQNCSISQLCLPVMLADAEIEHLDSIVKRRKPYQKDEILFRLGDELESLFAVRSGCIKTYTLDTSGVEQITGFYLPGEIIGLDAIHENSHQSFAKALDTSLVCALPYHKLDMLAGQIPGLRSQLLKVMSHEIQDDKALFLLLNKKNAEQRLAAFIINLSKRYANRGLASDRFQLPMTQVDIANYLGMAVETISRLFKKLNKLELLELKHKEITIINMNHLSQFAGTSCHA